MSHASETLAAYEAARTAFIEAHRAFARACLEAGVADRSGFRPPFRDQLGNEEYIEGAAELGADTASNLVYVVALRELADGAA